MKRIAIVGSGPLAERLIYYFESTSFAKVEGMFDDFEARGHIKYGRPILGATEDVPAVFKKDRFDAVAIGVGYDHMWFRKEMYERLKTADIPVATFIHPTSYVEKSAVIGEGSIILVGCTIDMHSQLGENVFLSSKCFLSHHVHVGSHTFCSPAVNLAGMTKVGQCCFIGISTTSISSVKIGFHVQTAAGAVITKDTPDHVLVAGVPGEVKKTISFNS
jgi:sugar O-acyltransferase (sialic acid O-acetyltransferase NeuD family)